MLLMGKKSNAKTFIDLFAGAGGLSTGLEMAGFECLYANELEPNYSATLKFNHPNTEVQTENIRAVSPDNVRKALGLRKGELDLLAGGPPCQGFSVNAPVRSLSDERNHLFLYYLKFVEAFLPKTVLIENVPGIVSFESGQTVEAIFSSLKSLGYNPKLKILYAAHYGVPQMRWRAIFLATKIGTPEVSYPLPTHLAEGRANFTVAFRGERLTIPRELLQRHAGFQQVTVSEAISDLPEIPNGSGQEEFDYTSNPASAYQAELRQGSTKIYNHICAGLGKANLDRLPHIPPGGSWRDIPHDLLPEGMKRARRSDHTKRYGRLHPDGLCSTVLTKCDPHWGTYIHYSQDRVLSVREAARIQSFPDRIKFLGSLIEQYEQVGNAVPPAFARAIGEAIMDSLNAVPDKAAKSIQPASVKQQELFEHVA